MTSPAHRKSSGKNRTTIALAGIAVVAIVAVAIGFIATRGSSSHKAATTSTGSSGGSGSDSSSSTSSTSAPPPPLTVLSVTPATAATNVAPNTPIQITFSQPLAPHTPTPTLNPPAAGSWAVSGATMTFHPTGGYLPYATEQLTVPASVTTAKTKHKKAVTLAAADSVSFKVANGSPLRVEQMLAELDYMPVNFVSNQAATAAPTTTSSSSTPAATPTTAAATGASSSSSSSSSSSTSSTTAPAVTPAQTTLNEESNQADGVATMPLPGTFPWRFGATPPTLASLWTPGTANVIDQGAIMAFENAHGMKMDGLAGPQVWAALVQDIAARKVTTAPYYYLLASKTEPESLTVFRDGASIYSSPANTGVAAAPTPDGTWPVYDRYASTTMTGQNPDGSTYNDPAIPWVAYFHGGDAVHGFDRGSYGVPQSVGCVELPEDNAKVVWQYDPYGTLVTVS